MRTTIERLFLAAALGMGIAACSWVPTESDGSDPYLGYVDGLELDSKLQPTPTTSGVCPNGPCYPVQEGYAAGNPFFFYNLGTVPTASFPLNTAKSPAVLTSLITNNVYDFSPGCTAGPAFDPVADAYPSSVQFPIYGSLPITSFVFDSIVVPFVNRFAATEAAGTTCQALKNATSIGVKFGSAGGSMADFRMWPVIDTVTTGTLSSGIASSHGVSGSNCFTPDGVSTPCPVQELPSATLQAQCTTAFNTCNTPCTDEVCKVVCETNFIQCATLERQGWFGDLQLTFLDGGPIPVDPSTPGQLLVMDGVIVDPTPDPSVGLGPYSHTTDSRVIILPAVPGQSGYSPIVRLHDFPLPSGGSFGQFNAICPTPGSCAPNEVDMTQTQSASQNTIFIVATAP